MPRIGYKHTEETRKKLSESHKGYVMPESQKKKIGEANKGGNSGSFKIGSEAHLGHKHSEETKRKISQIKKGTPAWNKGKKASEESKRKMSLARQGKPALWNRGEKSNLWKGGLVTTNKKIRDSLEYKIWRRAVFERDGYKCIWCGKQDKTIQADHIKPFAMFPELRFAIDNGRTLCRDCHKTTDTWGVNLHK